RASDLVSSRCRPHDHRGVDHRRADVPRDPVRAAREPRADVPRAGVLLRRSRERDLQRDAGQPAPSDHASAPPGADELGHALHRLGDDSAGLVRRRHPGQPDRRQADADRRRCGHLPSVPRRPLLAGARDPRDAGARRRTGGRLRSARGRRRPPARGAHRDVVRALLGIRDARVFLFGWTLSQFGDWAMIIVLAVWAKALTDSNASAGLVFFALAAPSIFAPLAGVVVDRVRRRPLLVSVYSIEAVVVLALLFVHDRGDVWILYA